MTIVQFKFNEVWTALFGRLMGVSYHVSCSAGGVEKIKLD